MAKMKISVVLEDELIKKVDEILPERKRSAFISRAVEKELRRLQQEQLREDYLEAFSESEAECQELDGVVADGID